MSKQLTRDQRGRIAEKVMEWGNLIFVGMVVTQLFSDSKFNFPLAVVGIIIGIIAYIAAIIIMKGGGK